MTRAVYLPHLERIFEVFEENLRCWKMPYCPDQIKIMKRELSIALFCATYFFRIIHAFERNILGVFSKYQRTRAVTFSYFQRETVVLSYGEYNSDLDICSCRICWRTRSLRHGRRRPKTNEFCMHREVKPRPLVIVVEEAHSCWARQRVGRRAKHRI